MARLSEAVRQRPFLATLGMLVLVLVASAVGLLALIYSEAGRALLVRQLERTLSTPGTMEVAIGRLDGPLPASLHIDRIALRDRKGDWLTIRDLTLDWSPAQLFAGRLQIDSLRAAEVVALRQPEPPEHPGSANKGRLPWIEVALDQAAIDLLRLDEPVVGQAADLGIAASAAALRDRLSLKLAINRLDERTGDALIDLSWDAARRSLDLDVKASEAADGLVARLLRLPANPPMDLSIAGKGPADDWHGNIDLEAGSLLSLRAALSIALGEEARLALRGEATPGDSLGPGLVSLTGPRSEFDLEFGYDAASSRWTLAVNDLRSASLAARGRIALQDGGAALDGVLELETLDALVLAPLVAPAAFTKATATVEFAGTPTAPDIAIDGTIDDLRVKGYAAARSALRAVLRPDGFPTGRDSIVDVDGEVQFDEFSTPFVALSDLLGPSPRIATTRARFGPGGMLDLGDAALTGAFVAVTLNGSTAMDSVALTVGGRVSIADLAPLSQVAGRSLKGEATAGFEFAREAGGGVELAWDGTLRDAGLEQPLAERLLGGNAAFSGAARRAPDGALSFSGVTLSGAGATARISLALNAGHDRLDGAYDVTVSDLDALGIGDPERPAGALRLNGKATGSPINPLFEGELQLENASPGGFRLARIEAHYTASDLPVAPRGDIRIEGEAETLAALAGHTNFLLDGGRLRLSGLSLSARNTTLEGNLSAPLNGDAVTGRLTARAPDIADWSTVAGGRLAGRLDGRIELSGKGRRQDAALDAKVSEFAYGDGLSSHLVTLNMRLADLTGAASAKGAVVARDTQGGAVQLDEISLKLDGPRDDIGYRLNASGKMAGRALNLDSEGKLRREGERITLSVARMAGELGGVPIRLRRPALAEVAPAWDSGDLDLAVGDGSLGGRYRQGSGRVSAQIAMQEVPVAAVWPAAPPQLGRAIFEGRASLEGPETGPAGSLDLSVTGLAAGESTEAKQGLALRLDGGLRDNKLTATVRLEGLEEFTMDLRGAVPARLSMAPPAFAMDDEAPLAGNLRIAGPVGPAWTLAGFDRHRLEGLADIDLVIAGTIGEPAIAGRAELTGGRYEYLDTSTILSDIEVSARPSLSSIAIDRATARDGGDGEVALTGDIAFGGDSLWTVDLRADLSGARLVRRDELDATATGQLTLVGDATRRRLGGSLEIDQAEIRLIGGLPAGVVEIPVQEIGRAPAGTEPKLRPKPSRTDLDLDISMPKRVFVRGRGLDSEWGGELKISGTTAAPRAQGELRPLRGRYDFAGKIFDLREGSIVFAGKDEIDPALDLSAERRATDLTAIIRVTGTARKPVVTLESVPQYPQDEVLARILFNKSTGRLSATEALQLAQAVGTLTGATDGGGIIDFARGMLNLDVLRFEGGTEESEGGAEAGKYLTDRVYVGVEGNAAGETGVTVEVDITPRLKLESDVGQKDRSQFGIKWKRDY